MASTHLTRTFGSATTQQTWTMSFWVKRGKLGVSQFIAFCTGANSNNNWLQVGFNNDDRFILSGYSTAWLKTTRLFRDPSAWYHIVVQADSPQGTASNRLKVYVNGVQETSFETDNRSSITQSQTWGWNRSDGYVHYIGSEAGSGYFDGYLSHFHFSDGSIIAPTVFGSTDSTTGEWKIDPDASFTLGNNGFTILKDGNTVTDQSTNSNDFSVASGTLTKSEDNPSNVFCTYNKLQQTNGAAGFENGNTEFVNTTQGLGVNGTIAATSGKDYAEFKVTGSTGWGVGVADVDSDANRTDYLSSANNGYQSKYTGGKQIFLNGSTIVAQENNSTVVNNAGMGNTSFANNDIVMVALDLDNNNLFFGKNGTWLRGATESEIEAGTSTNATFSGTSFNNKFWTWSVCTELENMRMNAGNGYFSTTAVSSAGTNASGIGIFEYDVPDGFTALSTKGLNE